MLVTAPFPTCCLLIPQGIFPAQLSLLSNFTFHFFRLFRRRCLAARRTPINCSERQLEQQSINRNFCKRNTSQVRVLFPLIASLTVRRIMCSLLVCFCSLSVLCCASILFSRSVTLHIVPWEVELDHRLESNLPTTVIALGYMLESSNKRERERAHHHLPLLTHIIFYAQALKPTCFQLPALSRVRVLAS